MKKLLFLSLGFFLFPNFASAQQLAGTDWATKWGLPINDSIFYKFQGGTLYITDKANTNIFTSTYTESNDTLRVKDVSGSHACNPSEEGVYTFEINGNTLSITLVIDPCQVREGVLPSRPLKKRIIASAGRLPNQSSIEIYPNPVQEQLSLSWSVEEIPLKVRVVSITGKFVYEESDLQPSGMSIDCSSWPKGMYFMQFHHAEGIRTKKIVKR
jgi:hypothetical protein